MGQKSCRSLGPLAHPREPQCYQGMWLGAPCKTKLQGTQVLSIYKVSRVSSPSYMDLDLLAHPFGRSQVQTLNGYPAGIMTLHKTVLAGAA